MSIPVDLERLAEALADFGAGYLVTVGGDGRAKVVTVEPTVVGAEVRLPASRGSAANLAANPAATLVFPPAELHGYTLLVDGTARTGEDAAIVFTPGSAVLHRPASHADGPLPPEGCGQDCRPV